MSADHRLALKRRVAVISRRFPRAGLRRIIISYHAVGSGPWSTEERRFREQIEWLAANARLRSLDEILEQPAIAEDLQVAVTFDDGYHSVFSTAAPILKQAGVSPTLFVNTSCVADTVRATSDAAKGYYPDEQFLRWDEIRELRCCGWGMGSHGLEHPDLTRQPVQNVLVQMTRSKQMLEERLGAPCPLFAYPFGRNNRHVRAAAAESGYRWGLGSIHGTLSGSVERYAVPRIDIRRDYELQDFIAVIRGDWDYLRIVQTARHALRFFA